MRKNFFNLFYCNSNFYVHIDVYSSNSWDERKKKYIMRFYKSRDDTFNPKSIGILVILKKNSGVIIKSVNLKYINHTTTHQ